MAGERSVGLATGFLLMWHSLAASLGAWLGGVMYDTDGSYATALLACAAVAVAGAVACATLLGTEPLLRGERAAKELKDSDE